MALATPSANPNPRARRLLAGGAWGAWAAGAPEIRGHVSHRAFHAFLPATVDNAAARKMAIFLWLLAAAAVPSHSFRMVAHRQPVSGLRAAGELHKAHGRGLRWPLRAEEAGDSDFDEAFRAFAGERGSAPQEKGGDDEIGLDKSAAGPKTAPAPRRKVRGGDPEKRRAAMKEQGPAAELRSLQEAPLFGWAQEDDGPFLLRVATVWVGAFAVFGFPIASVTYPNAEDRLTALIAGNIGAALLCLVLMLRLGVGWSYIQTRLESELLDYEESNWANGFVSRKDPETAKRDKLLASLEVAPVMGRIRKVGAGIAAIFVALTFLLKVTSPTDPYEMYDPSYLERLAKDDDAAEEAAAAARKAGNRPAYCANRYYRTISGANLCD